MLTIDSCYRHFSSSVPSKPTSISEPAGAAPYRWIENETDYRCTKSADETRLFLFFSIYTQKFGSDDAVPTQLKHLPSGCGELQCQRYKYTAAIPQSWYPRMAATGLRQMNECFRGLFMCLLCYLCCVVLNSITGLSWGVIVSFALRIEAFVFMYIYVIQCLLLHGFHDSGFIIHQRMDSNKRSSLLFQLLFSSRHSP